MLTWGEVLEYLQDAEESVLDSPVLSFDVDNGEIEQIADIITAERLLEDFGVELSGSQEVPVLIRDTDNEEHTCQKKLGRPRKKKAVTK